jgi:hypothetical protein
MLANQIRTASLAICGLTGPFSLMADHDNTADAGGASPLDLFNKLNPERTFVIDRL